MSERTPFIFPTKPTHSHRARDFKEPVEWFGFAHQPEMLVYFTDSTRLQLAVMRMHDAIDAGVFEMKAVNPDTRDYLRKWAEAFVARSSPPPMLPYPKGSLHIVGSTLDPCENGWPEPIPMTISDSEAEHV